MRPAQSTVPENELLSSVAVAAITRLFGAVQIVAAVPLPLKTPVIGSIVPVRVIAPTRSHVPVAASAVPVCVMSMEQVMGNPRTTVAA